MNLRFLTLACLVTAATFAADAPSWARTKAGPSWCRRMRSRTAR
ncbi:MAG: hypothetical protein R3F13_14970 [Prosthecobacter sp.]